MMKKAMLFVMLMIGCVATNALAMDQKRQLTFFEVIRENDDPGVRSRPLRPTGIPGVGFPQKPSEICFPCTFDMKRYDQQWREALGERIEEERHNGKNEKYLWIYEGLLLWTLEDNKQEIQEKIDKCAKGIPLKAQYDSLEKHIDYQ